MLMQLFCNDKNSNMGENQVYTPMILTVQQYGTLWGSLENHKDPNKYMYLILTSTLCGLQRQPWPEVEMERLINYTTPLLAM